MYKRQVPARDLPRVATRFFRAANTVGQGSGLGLAIARALVERAGGIFEVDSGPSGGLCLTMRIPAPVATHSS